MRGLECVCHTHRALIPQERHHVWPLGYHGPDIEANKITVCANAHSDIHYLLEAMLRQHPYDVRQYGLKIRIYAKKGYDQVMAYGETMSR